MEVCAICLDNIESEEDKYVIGHCNHSFHSKCLTESLKYNKNCPH